MNLLGEKCDHMLVTAGEGSLRDNGGEELSVNIRN